MARKKKKFLKRKLRIIRPFSLRQKRTLYLDRWPSYLEKIEKTWFSLEKQKLFSTSRNKKTTYFSGPNFGHVIDKTSLKKILPGFPVFLPWDFLNIFWTILGSEENRRGRFDPFTGGGGWSEWNRFHDWII